MFKVNYENPKSNIDNRQIGGGSAVAGPLFLIKVSHVRTSFFSYLFRRSEYTDIQGDDEADKDFLIQSSYQHRLKTKDESNSNKKKKYEIFRIVLFHFLSRSIEWCIN